MTAGRLLLFAEDDATDAFLLERAVKKAAADVQVRRVANGDELIQYLKGAGRYCDRSAFPVPDVVLLDLKMPGTDGFGVLEWRQSQEEAQCVPVVVLSSSGLETDIRRAYKLGASSYVVKPGDPSRLAGIMQSLKAWWCEINAVPHGAA